jgi:hypothetical protein
MEALLQSQRLAVDREKSERTERKRQRKHERKKDRKQRRHVSSDSESDDERLPLLQSEPWHVMQFQLIDRVNSYGLAAPDSATLCGLAPAGAPTVTDMTDFERLIDYVRKIFYYSRVAHRAPPAGSHQSRSLATRHSLALLPRRVLTETVRMTGTAGLCLHRRPDDASRIRLELQNFGRGACDVARPGGHGAHTTRRALRAHTHVAVKRLVNR